LFFFKKYDSIKPNIEFILGASGASAGPGFPGIRYRSAPVPRAGAATYPSNPSRVLAVGRIGNKTRSLAYYKELSKRERESCRKNSKEQAGW
jgi:hypothetical protein